MVALKRKQKAHVIIHNIAVAAGGAGAGWLSDLLLLPDTIPIFVLWTVLFLGIALIFRLRVLTALLIALPCAFCAAVLYWALSLGLGDRFGEHSLLVTGVLLSAALTEVLGWLAYHLLWSVRPGQRAADHHLIAAAVQAASHGPLRVLLTSVPMLAALAGVFGVTDARTLAEIRARAPGGTVPLRIEYPVVGLREGLLHLSGEPASGGERVDLVVRNSLLATAVERQVIQPAVPRARVLARLRAAEAGAKTLTIDETWEVGVALTSNYWDKVRGRLYLLLAGMLGSLAMVWLGHRQIGRMLRAAQRDSAATAAKDLT